MGDSPAVILYDSTGTAIATKSSAPAGTENALVTRNIPSGTQTIAHLDVRLDAFGRFRTSSPQTLFDSKLLHDNAPLFWDDQQTSGASTTSTYNTNQSSVTLHVATTTAGTRVRQTFRRFNYQPGKALSNDEKVLTNLGWKRMGDMQAGDIVFDGNGAPSRVKYVAPQGERQLYRITFDDGTTVDADGEHLWVTIIRQNSKKGQREILTTNEMLERYGSRPDSWQRWRIPSSPVLEIPQCDISIDPYTMGMLLGDGCFVGTTPTFTCADVEMLQWIKGDVRKQSKKYGYSICKISDEIKKLGLYNHRSYEKFIPQNYLWNSTENRLAILQGLMDTDGTVASDGAATYTTVSLKLAEDVEFLVRSLGGQTKRTLRPSGYRKNGIFKRCLDSYLLQIIMPICPFRLSRKASKWKPRTRVSFDRYVHSIEKIHIGLATCIAVESKDKTFLTAGHIVTHNSHLITMTGIIGTGASGITKRIGYFDAKNGVFFEQAGTTINIAERTFTSGSAVDTKVAQSSWNLDKLDGTGTSGATLDVTKTQIFVMDLQWLGVGRVRYGFFIGEQLIYVHETFHSNVSTLVYMSTPNLPLRYEISNDGTGAASNLVHICSAVLSEAGREDTGFVLSADRGVTSLTTLNNTNLYPLVAIRLNSATLDATIDPLSISVVCSSTAAFKYMLLLNPTVTGTALSFSQVTNSSVDAATGTTNGTTVSGGTQIVSGYSQGSANTGFLTVDLPNYLAIGSTIAGVADIMVLAVARITGTTEDFFGSITWREEV